MIPVNKEKLPLLPRTNNNFELWPMILSKALLKLSSLTSNSCEIIDFHPVACLTGKERNLNLMLRCTCNLFHLFVFSFFERRMGLFEIQDALSIAARQMGFLEKIRGSFRMGERRRARKSGLVTCFLSSLSSP